MNKISTVHGWALTAGVLLAAAGTAQEATPSNPASPQLQPRLDDWRQAHGQNWRMYSDGQTGHARMLYGGSAQPGIQARTDSDYFAIAREFLGQAEGLTGVEGETLVESRTVFLPLALAGSTDKFVVEFRQEKNGVPVLGGSATALFHLGGELLSLDTTGLPNLDGFDTTPTNPAESATSVAIDAFQATTGTPANVVGQASLVIDRETVDKLDAPVLAWQVDIAHVLEGQVPESYRYTVAAQGDLRVVNEENRVHHFDVGGNVTSLVTPGLLPDTSSNPEVAMPAKYMTVTATGAGSTTTDANGDFNFPGVNGPLNVTFTYQGTYNDLNDSSGAEYTLTQSLTGTGNAVLMNPGTAQDDTAEANVFHHINEMRDWTRSLDASDGMMDFVNDANVMIASSCNAFYDGISTNYYNIAGGCNNTAYSTVIAHEQGHWLNDRYGSGNGSDGFGEGNADVFAMYYNDSAVVGDDFFTSGGFIRTGNNTRQYCGDGNGGCYGQVHADGEVWMGAAWKVRDNLNTTLGDAPGDLTADLLFNGWMNAYNQGNISSIIETQWLTLDDDNGDINDGTPNYQDIDDGFTAQGFPGFELSFITFQNVVEVDDTLDDCGPYGVAADLTPLVGSSIIGANIFYSVDGGAFNVVPMSLFTGNTYAGVIPGAPSPATVTWYMNAADDLGNVDTWPKDAPTGVFTFRVGDSEIFFTDDFETADDNGWTHAQVATQDDWQHDVPNGASGSSNGISWSDPASAFSGTQIWGNDLAPSGFNGSYQPNVINYLRSPLIDLSSATGSTLKFKRWLTVEEAIFDQAEIRVNGTTLWTNALNGNHIDTAWTDFELDISSIADGNSAAEIEFRLTTDGGLELGGWNIDDLEILTLDPTPSLGVPVNYGVGLAGTGGIVPGLDSAKQPTQVGNSDNKVVVKDGLPGATAFIGLGTTAISQSIFGGTLLVDPNLRVFVQNLDAFGQTEILLPLGPDPSPVGSTFYFQAFILDPGATAGVSMSPGLTATIIP